MIRSPGSNYPSNEIEDDKLKLSFAFQYLNKIEETMLPKNADKILVLGNH
jgi:hypothetical protein